MCFFYKCNVQTPHCYVCKMAFNSKDDFYKHVTSYYHATMASYFASFTWTEINAPFRNENEYPYFFKYVVRLDIDKSKNLNQKNACSEKKENRLLSTEFPGPANVLWIFHPTCQRHTRLGHYDVKIYIFCLIILTSLINIFESELSYSAWYGLSCHISFKFRYHWPHSSISQCHYLTNWLIQCDWIK